MQSAIISSDIGQVYLKYFRWNCAKIQIVMSYTPAVLYTVEENLSFVSET